MNAELLGPLRRTATTVTKLPAVADNKLDRQPSDSHEHVPIYFNTTYVLPNSAYEKDQWESEAQIAARKAMAKRSSRSYAARISRTRSRKKEVQGRPAKPGITLDTSFARHKGSAPRQVYPQEIEVRGNGAVRKPGRLGLGRPATRTKGLGIMKVTPQPGREAEDFVSPKVMDYRVSANASACQISRLPGVDTPYNKEPKTADSLTPGSRTWLEISPSDRPIPIGISIPSDSIPDFSPYQSTRERSGSDATLVTPSIIITPAAAMKSVWSPDTESDYTTGRSSSIYSRATFNIHFHSTTPDAPPVPILPPNILKSNTAGVSSDSRRDTNEPIAHARKSTLDSAVTAFEEDDDTKRKDRITSTGTYFEEDETPLHERTVEISDLSIDTAITPTPRRSRGWWNVITTPFEFSRRNSVWTQHERTVDETPAVPVVPRRFDDPPSSLSTPSTYIWSATDKSPSVLQASPLVPVPLANPISNSEDDKLLRGQRFDQDFEDKLLPNNGSQAQTNATVAEHDIPKGQHNTQHPFKQMPLSNEQNVASPLSAMSASPVLGTATIGTMLMPRQISEGTRQINMNIELQDRRQVESATAAATVSAPVASTTLASTPGFNVAKSELSSSSINSLQKAPPQFDPPPTTARISLSRGHDHGSRASSPISTELKNHKKQTRHRKVANIMDWLPFGRRKQGDKKKETKRSGSRRWCCVCCCCIILIILLAVIIPVTVVITQKNNDSKGVDPPSSWLNLTGYPPMPTGVSTIAQPQAVDEESGCMVPATVWSCALPKEQQQQNSPNKPNQPNFKFEITFKNGTVADPSKTQLARRAPKPVSAGALVRSRFLQPRATPVDSVDAPSLEDMRFLGNTTDGITAPFEGEDTPFFIGFKDVASVPSSRLVRRAESSENFTDAIPPPSLNPDGTAAPANLYPLALDQPLRLYNRGKAEEHFGFYVYYSRSIFLKSINSNDSRGGNPADVDGGSPFEAASLRCTYTQTRFHVQIWTSSQTTKPLLQGSPTNVSSGADISRPGSFPYPVTITIDRHGGNARDKMVFCYDMEKDGTIKNEDGKKTFLLEDRKFGGVLVNPSQGPFENVNGPIDGGTGGCRCQWQNWFG
ncbi:hypothetical protein CC78DRAFT_135379 [Lojkania enalia]|uniref:Glycoprotease family protein n=1 Tax=Lojkania enalia TaxID=147567 RepID=A0A9P4NCG3_9PLEO|nr:hypothetical protein CC78DRAFT_135379 [Didymosphaeria enalia]